MSAAPDRIMTADDAAALVPDDAVVAITGSGGGILEADVVFAAIERRFLATGSPRGLTIVHGLGIGDGETTGLSRFAHEGMTKRVIGGHWSWSRPMQRLAASGDIEAYSFPAGVIATLLRESGAGRPGLFTTVGLGSFADPRDAGGRLNAAATEDLVKVVEIEGKEYLHYLPLRVDVGILRGSTADPGGHVSWAQEASLLDSQAVAIAAKGNGGLVIAQVKEVVGIGVQDPRLISVPGPLIDVLVEAPEQWQTYAAEHDPMFNSSASAAGPMRPAGGEAEDDLRTIVARRAASEVPSRGVINVGFGMSAGVVNVLATQGRLSEVQLIIEQGAVGGHPENGDLFGLSRLPDALMSSLIQFDFFASGIIDVAVLGMAELDRHGNVNVSRIGDRTVGPGGFLDIVHGASRVVFCGSFTARGLTVGATGDALQIVSEGSVHKLVDQVSHVTYDAAAARARGQSAIYVTERAVFELREDGIELVEVAPGIDVERDVLAQMDFTPIVRDVRLMPASAFSRSIVPVPLASHDEAPAVVGS
jgi:acyl CoA:acetate/3-ketoacid CoA transferase